MFLLLFYFLRFQQFTFWKLLILRLIYFSDGRFEPNIEQIKFLSVYFNVPTDYLLGKDIIMVNDEKEFEIVTNHFKQDINDDIISEVVELLEELNEKNKVKIFKIIKDAIELLK